VILNYFLYRLSLGASRVCFLWCSFLGVWLFAGLRGSVGQDTPNYTAHFNGLVSWSDRMDYFSSIEPFFALLMISFSLIFDSVSPFFMFISFVQALLVFNISGRLYHGGAFFLAYILIFYVSMHFNVLRAGLAALLFVQAILYSGSRKGIFYLALSMMTHVSVFALLPFYIYRSKLGLKGWFSLVFVCVFFGAFFWSFMGEYLSHKVQVYLMSVDFELNVSISMLALIVSGFFVYMVFDLRFSKEAIMAYLMMSIWMVLTTSFPVFHRFYQITFLLFLFFVFEKRFFGFENVSIRPFAAYSLMLVMYFSLMIWVGMLGEAQRIKSSGIGSLDYTFLPYEMFFLEH